MVETYLKISSIALILFGVFVLGALYFLYSRYRELQRHVANLQKNAVYQQNVIDHIHSQEQSTSTNDVFGGGGAGGLNDLASLLPMMGNLAKMFDTSQEEEEDDDVTEVVLEEDVNEQIQNELEELRVAEKTTSTTDDKSTDIITTSEKKISSIET